MIEGEKPKKPYDNLGGDVVVTTEKIENDRWAQQMLHEIGRTMAEPGFEYLGSAAFHVYQTKSMLTVQTRDAQIKHQVALKPSSDAQIEVSAELTQYATLEFVKQVAAHYRGRQLNSIDPKYKVKP